MTELPRRSPMTDRSLIDAVVNRTELAMPPSVTLEMAKGFTLYMVKAVISGRGDEVVDLAKIKSLALKEVDHEDHSHLPVLVRKCCPRSGSTTRLPDFVALMKPRVMLLAVFTAFVGMMIAPVHPDPLLGSIAMLAIAVGAGAAGVAQYVVRRRHRRGDDPHGAASDPSRQDFARRSACVRACPRLRRGRRSWHCVQCRGGRRCSPSRSSSTSSCTRCG